MGMGIRGEWERINDTKVKKKEKKRNIRTKRKKGVCHVYISNHKDKKIAEERVRIENGFEPAKEKKK